MARSSGSDSSQARYSLLAEWYKLVLGGVVILAAVGLLISKYVFGFPVTYEDIGILVVLGGGLLQIDFGLNLLQIVRQSSSYDDTPPPEYVSPPYAEDPTRLRPPVDADSRERSRSRESEGARGGVDESAVDGRHSDTGRSREDR